MLYIMWLSYNKAPINRLFYLVNAAKYADFSSAGKNLQEPDDVSRCIGFLSFDKTESFFQKT